MEEDVTYSKKISINNFFHYNMGHDLVLIANYNEGVGITMTSYSHPLIFPTEEMAVDFLNCFRALCNTANVLL